MQQCLAHLQELVSWSLCIRWVSFLLWPDQCWLSIKKLLRIWYRPKPTLHSAATPQFPAQHSEMCRWSHILCPSIYYCILHALLKCSAYCSRKGKNWRKREKNERHTHWNECQVNFLRFLMQCSVSWSWTNLVFWLGAGVVVGTIYHLLLLRPLCYLYTRVQLQFLQDSSLASHTNNSPTQQK